MRYVGNLRPAFHTLFPGNTRPAIPGQPGWYKSVVTGDREPNMSAIIFSLVSGYVLVHSEFFDETSRRNEPAGIQIENACQQRSQFLRNVFVVSLVGVFCCPGTPNSFLVNSPSVSHPAGGIVRNGMLYKFVTSIAASVLTPCRITISTPAVRRRPGKRS